MSLSFTPSDNFIGPIIHQLATIISTQISGIGEVYERPPDKPLENKSVLIPLTKFKIEGDTNGKMYVKLTFGIRLVFRRKKLPDDIYFAYTYLLPFLQCLGAQPNQTLTDSNGNQLAEGVYPSDGGVMQWVEAAEPHLALVINTDVLTEFNVPTF